jgi:para-aminobenzoate synthetase component 1
MRASARQHRIHEIAYSPDTRARFGALAAQPWSVLLDSGGTGGDRGRFDIFAAEPYVTIATVGEVTRIVRDGRVQESGEDPFRLLRAQLGEVGDSASALPFCGGAIGCFAYDLGRRLERLRSLAAQDVDLPEMAIGLYDWAVIVDHVLKRAWLVAGCRNERTRDEWDRIVELVQRPPEPLAPAPYVPAGHPVSNFDRQSYARAFARIMHYIREGDCYQVNLAQRFSGRYHGDPWRAYLQLQHYNPAPFSAYMNLPEGQVLSSSPERFLRVRGGVVETRPIKGTRRRSVALVQDWAFREDLKDSSKDRAENLMIVDLLRNDLGKNCTVGSVDVPELFAVESFATVHHLVSTVTGRLAAGRHALDLLAGCFPGGSITGAPKLRAMEIIEELEPHRRSVYCGAIGYIGYDGAMDLNIAIRTLVMNQGWMHCWAGGGIVVDSSVEAEYQESQDKAAAMLKLYAVTEAGGVGC